MAEVIPEQTINDTIRTFNAPAKRSHKGQNGRLLVIGGSSLFHSAVLWSAQVASHFVDLVHFSSTKENEKIFINLKSKFTNGIVIKQEHLEKYVEEDDCVLLGPGMLRKAPFSPNNEVIYTKEITHKLLTNFPRKRFVIDAGALQMLDLSLLSSMKVKPILTPQTAEFTRLFNIDLEDKSLDEKSSIVKHTARDHNCVILLKSVEDIISDGNKTVIVKGGNEGLTKGGSGDVLAGLTSAFYTKNYALIAATLASYILNTTAEELARTNSRFYTTSDLVTLIPKVSKNILFDRR
ncbi:MAG: NAD(P)H-hydrate dehydratase [Candidatus Paceibacterota bacterium]